MFNWTDAQDRPVKKCVHQDDACTICAEAEMVKDKKIKVTVTTGGSPPRTRTFDEGEDWKTEVEGLMKGIIDDSKKAHDLHQAKMKERQDATNKETAERAAAAKEEEGREKVTITKDDVGTMDALDLK